MNTVLIVTPYFPPSNSVGAARPAAFVRYLPEFDWQPIVLTPNRGDHHWNNQPDIPIYYATFPTLESVYALARRYLHQPKPDKAIGVKNSRAIALHNRRQVFVDWLMVPDAGITWVPFGINQAMNIAKAYHIDAILTTAPEFSCHLVGLIVAHRLRCPWIAEFRDPWLTSPFMNYPTTPHKKFHAMLEHKVISSASRVVVTTDLICHDFCERYEDQSPDKFEVIHNGFDSDDFENLKSRRNNEDRMIYIVHSGSFYGERNPLTFLKALKRFDAQELKCISVMFLGRNMLALKPIIDDLDLDDTVILRDYVPYRESLQCLHDADILLLIPGGQLTQPKKLFEYLRLGKFILAPSANPAVNNLLNKVNMGLIVNPDSSDEIFDGLSELIRLVKSERQPNPNWKIIQQFDFKELTGQLARLLDNIAV